MNLSFIDCGFFSELKKDPGVPRLPDLKVKVHNAQKKAMVREKRLHLTLGLSQFASCWFAGATGWPM